MVGSWGDRGGWATSYRNHREGDNYGGGRVLYCVSWKGKNNSRPSSDDFISFETEEFQKAFMKRRGKLRTYISTGGKKFPRVKRPRSELYKPLSDKFKKGKSEHKQPHEKNQVDDIDTDAELDAGLHSDEVDVAETEVLIQEFDWLEEDQDPDLSKKKNTATDTQSSIPEPSISITGWGGAFAYGARSGGVDTSLEVDKPTERQNSDTTQDFNHSVRQNIRIERKSKDAGQIPFPERDRRTKRRRKHMSELSEGSRVRMGLNRLSTKDQTDTIAKQSLPEKEDTAAKADTLLHSVATTSSQGTTHKHEQEYCMWSIDTEPRHSPTQDEKKQKDACLELDQPMWVMDTIGEALPVESNDTYIELPADNNNLGRKRKRSRRDRRGQREKGKKVLRDSSIIMLGSNGEDSSEDDDAKAIEDYTQNIMGSDNEDGLSYFLGSFEELEVGPGHSSNIGGVLPDDSDEGIYGYDNERIDSIRKSGNRRRERRRDDRLTEAVDNALGLKRSGGAPLLEPSSRNVAKINKMIVDFIRDGDVAELRLPGMTHALSTRVFTISSLYKLDPYMIKEGDHVVEALAKTEASGFPKDMAVVDRLVRETDHWATVKHEELTIERSRSRRLESRDRFNQRRGRGAQGGFQRVQVRKKAMVAKINGTIVGESASPIPPRNVGHQLLSKMGWRPGDGLGTFGTGDNDPIEVIVKLDRHGLGHAPPKK